MNLDHVVFNLIGFCFGTTLDEQSIALLEEFSKDPEPIVSQSCEVALSIVEYERSGKSSEVNVWKLKLEYLHSAVASRHLAYFQEK